MTNLDKIMLFIIWACILGFISYQLVQEINFSKKCDKANGVIVVSPSLSAICIRHVAEQLND